MYGLLDTSVAVEVLRKRVRLDELQVAVRVWLVSAVTAGELFHGAFNSANPAHALAVLEPFLAEFGVIPVTQTTARIYGTIRTSLGREGKLIPENDMWIASSALEHALPLLSYDQHFNRIAQLNHHFIAREQI